MNTDKSASTDEEKLHQMHAQCKKELVNPTNVIVFGGYQIRWNDPSHHLAYKRLEALGFHYNKKCALSEVHTADWQRDSGFDITKNDGCFQAAVKRMLKDSNHLILVKCMGCAKGGAPTTDNNPSAWHMKCWRVCLDNHPKAADGYIMHLCSELAPRINKYFPQLTASQFYALYSALEDQFWVTLFDLKTKGKYMNDRQNDCARTYTGLISDFSLEKMIKNKQYGKYVIDMLMNKHYWYSNGTKYSCITAQSFITSSMMTQQQIASTQNDKSQYASPNNNNQASKPQFNKDNN